MIPGSTIDDKFEIVRKLGAGGYGAVFEAMHLQLGRRVALKILDPIVLELAGGAARFEQEAKAINAIQHRNIVGFLGHGVWNQSPYMVMELVKGESLQEVLAREQRLEPRRALRLIRQVFEAIGCAHSSGIIHRDLKPSNIMVGRDSSGAETIKIIDFGLAKLMPGYGLEAKKLTESGYAVGTCHYMPPEQALGQGVDQRSDIYSAGCILYQMLAGEPPFDGNDNLTVMVHHIHTEPPKLETHLKLSGEYNGIATLVNNCLCKDPQNRYQQCSAVISDIDAILAGKPEMLSSFSPKIRAAARKRSHRLRIAAMALFALVPVAATVSWLQPKPPDPLPVTRPPEVKHPRQMNAHQNPFSKSELVQPEKVDTKSLEERARLYSEAARRQWMMQLETTNQKLAEQHRKKSLQFLKEAIAARQALNAPDEIIDDKIIRGLNRIREREAAIKYCKFVLGMLDTESGDRPHYRETLCRLYRDTGNLAESEKIARELVADYSPDVQTMGKIYLANVLICAGRNSEAKKLLLPLTDERRAEGTRKRQREALARIAIREHRYREAAKYAEQSEAVHTSITPVANARRRYTPIRFAARILRIAAEERQGHNNKAKELLDDFYRVGQYTSYFDDDMIDYDTRLLRERIDTNKLFSNCPI